MNGLYLAALLLIPVAFASGWWLALRRGERRSGAKVRGLSVTYFRGLNYLLNEQPDKAIEVFLSIAEVDKDTVETHFALGNLFRRRGEVERAIRLHQNLVERPALSAEHRAQALLELGEDYMRAGLLDRAETLFTDLVGVEGSAPRALRHLISIDQQERDWDKAIAHAHRYEAATGEPMGRLIAQFHCELADQAKLRGDVARARDCVANAYSADPHCVRAGLLEAHLELAAGRDGEAIEAFERVARHDPEFLPELLRPLLAAYERRGERARARAFLDEMLERYAGVSPLLAQTRLIVEDEGVPAAIDFLTGELRRRPSVRGQHALIDLALAEPAADARGILQGLKQLSESLMAVSPAYRCGRCGFGARAHHWQCPSCKSWGTIKPMPGAACD